MRKVFAAFLTLVMILSVLPVAAFAANGETQDHTLLFDLAQAKGLSDLEDFYIQNYSTSKGLVNEDLQVSMENGVLTATNYHAAQGMVQLFDYPESSQSGKPYTVTATFRYEAYANSTHDAKGTRGGIAYNIKKGEFQGSWFAVRANQTYGVQTYIDGAYSNAYSLEDYVLSEAYKVGFVYTLTAKFYSDDWYELRVTDQNGNVIGKMDGMQNARCGSGIGLYVRGSTMTVTDFKVYVEKEKPIEKDSFDSAFDTYAPENGKKVFDLKDAKSEKDLPDWFAEAYTSSNVKNDMSAELKDGILTVINKAESFGTVNLFRYDRAKMAGNKFVVSMTVALNCHTGTHHTGDMALTSSGKVRGGIAFNFKQGCVDGQWAVLRNGTAEQAEIQSYTNAKNSNTKETISLEPFENTSYVLRLIFEGDGSFTYVIQDQAGRQYSEMKGSTTFNNDINFGVMSRNSMIVVSEFAISEFNTETPNSVRYVATQEPHEAAIGNTYAVRFVAGVKNLRGGEAGFRITTTDGKTSKTEEYPVTHVYDSLRGLKTTGEEVSYSAARLSSNYLMAVTVKNIPTYGGDIVFTVTPYYILEGERYSGKPYTVIYNAGKMKMQYVDEGAPLPYRYEGTELRLMTNNILTTATQPPGERVKLLSAMFHTYMPDILCLQEVNWAWYDYFPKYIEDEYTIVDVGPNGASVRNNANPIFYRTDRFELLEAKNFSSSAKAPKDELTYAVLLDKNSGKKIIVFSLHWLVNSKTNPAEVADACRQESARVILQTISELKAKYNTEYAFVLGDYNAIESTQSYKDITAGLSDAKYIAEVRSNTVNNTGHTFGKGPLIASCAPRNYDYIMVNEQAVRVLTHDIIKNSYAVNSSDHCPVYVDVILK